MSQQQVLSQTHENNEYLSTLFQVIGGSLFIALCAQIKIPLWFTPVPISLQTLAAMLIGGMYGARMGTMSLVLYLAQISAGLPVCVGGVSDSLRLFGPSAGYLYGMVVQTYLVGWLFERRSTMSSAKLLLSVLAVSFIQLGMGTAWLAAFVGWKNAPMMGFYPFIPGDIIKVIAATTFCQKIRKI